MKQAISNRDDCSLVLIDLTILIDIVLHLQWFLVRGSAKFLIWKHRNKESEHQVLSKWRLHLQHASNVAYCTL